MKNLKRSLLAVFLLTTSVGVVADDWESATNVSSEEYCAYPYCKCVYETLGGFRFSVTVKASYCPSSIEVDMERGKWRE